MDVLRPADDIGVMSASGRIDGELVVAYSVGTTPLDGELSVEGSRRVVEAIDAAVRGGHPVVGVWHSGGIRLSEGVGALDGLGRVLAAIARAAGRVPQISVMLGPCDGGVGYAPALTDVVIAAPAGRRRATGSVTVRAGIGFPVRTGIGSAGDGPVRDRGFDGAHVRAADEADAIARARRITSLLNRPGRFDLGAADDPTEPRTPLPRRARQVHDVKPLLKHLLDSDPRGRWLEELQPGWAPNMVVGLGRLAGATVGVLANNPARDGGRLDSPAAEKAARFVRMCDAFGVPMVVVADVPGDPPKAGEQWAGVSRREAELLHAFAEAVVPRVTLVTRKSCGGAYIAMNAAALGATAVFAWPAAEIAMPGTKAADLTAGIGVVDEVIDPVTTRRRLAEALASASATRGTHDNVPL